MAIDWTTVLVAIFALLGSAGIWTYLDHRMQRKADREQKNDEIMDELKAIRQELVDLRETVDENEAKASRIRILKFADEVFMEMNHSKDAFDQCLSDVTFYEKFCGDNPNFRNHQTEETVAYIKEVYHERMKKKDFARYGALRNGGV